MVLSCCAVFSSAGDSDRLSLQVAHVTHKAQAKVSNEHGTAPNGSALQRQQDAKGGVQIASYIAGLVNRVRINLTHSQYGLQLPTL